MISPLPSYDDELLNSAYANVSLIADKAWAFDHEDPYRKLNHSLWIQNCEIIAKYEGKCNYRPRFVRDVISESRLAKYGNYEYDEQRERLYKPNDDRSSSELQQFSQAEATEPWTLPEVQELFARLISSNCKQSHREFSAISIPKCNTAKIENEAGCSNFRLEGNERSKKWRQKIKQEAKENRRTRLHGESLSIRTLDEYENPLSEACKRSAKAFTYRRYTIENNAEMQLQARIENNAVRKIWVPEKFQQRPDILYQQCYQNKQSQTVRPSPSVHHAQRHQQLHCALQYQPLVLRTEYQRRLLPSSPILGTEVPEFFPKTSVSPVTHLNNDKERKTCQLRYFPSLNERSYQNELFPYNRPQHETAVPFPNARIPILPATEANVFFRPPQEWIQRIVPMQTQTASSLSQPICTLMQPIHDTAIVHRPLQIYGKFLPSSQSTPSHIPIYQRPMELYQEPTPKRDSHGVDFNNLILLTKNSIKTRRSQSKNTQQSILLLESKQPTSKNDQNVVSLFQKGCTRKMKRVMTMNALVSELRSFEEKYEYNKPDASWGTSVESVPRQSENMRTTGGIVGNIESQCASINIKENDKNIKKPLYRDILTKTSSSHGIASENVLEKRYDELEQQAMEQYRNSEESLALKYQELEHQAMQQYRNSTDEFLLMPGTSEKQINTRLTSSKSQNCSDGQKCSGYGQCSSSKKNKEKNNSFLQSRITLLKPKGKSLPNILHRSSCKNSAQEVPGSLSTLIERSSRESENAYKAASGDRIDANARTSLKRRLILMSPFDRKSEARLMNTTDLHEIYSLSQARRNVLEYYRTSEAVRNGSGDENITIIQSPNAKVWLSGFWTA